MSKSKDGYSNSLKSKELIKKTLIEIIKARTDDKPITVVELVKKAHINRGTFYFHYKNIDEVIRANEQDILDDLKKILIVFSRELAIKKDASSLIECITNFIKSDEKLFSYFLASYEFHYFVDKSKTEIIQFILNNFFTKYDDKLLISITFYVNGMFGLYQDYYNHRIKMSFEDMNKAIISLLNRALNA